MSSILIEPVSFSAVIAYFLVSPIIVLSVPGVATLIVIIWLAAMATLMLHNSISSVSSMCFLLISEVTCFIIRYN